MPPDDIRNTNAIAKKLRRSVVIEEPVEFAIRVGPDRILVPHYFRTAVQLLASH